MNTLKVFYNTFRQLTWNKIIRLLKFSLGNPIFSILSFYATLKTYSLAKQYYPETSSTNGKGNAFRHALWNCLILMYCCKVSSPKKAFKWCQEATDFHEELFPNEALQTQMDLHNNEIGRQLFFKMLPGIHRQFFETSFFIAPLQQLTEEAIFISNSEAPFPKEKLVYLEK
ncbi:hypothetical protein [Elizabethkingia sp. JS20170427COW]|uniref:DUF6973 domain-containing protein n=1 Tax=Elizabethkingia sp. JS20170427COW TaxID=2583851 RepID=UPI001110EF08|nr:hypothetical protein [Elizabethkingia sp. JS20170427COW]QCX53166.1 hypothetical protein FGE20_05205 [Elizabethkingia sp. JS20170427COW]